MLIDTAVRHFLLSCALLFANPASQAATWSGPDSGPAAAAGKQVIFIASDFRNGVVVVTYRSFEQAARHIGWQVKVLDGQGDPAQLLRVTQQALDESPDGIVLGGFDPGSLGELAARMQTQKVPLVGWHAGASPGPQGLLFNNISSDPLAVADMAAELVARDGKAGVVIFTDSLFSIATRKSQRMAERIQACTDCRLLSIEDLPIAQAGARMGDQVLQLSQRFGPTWTHTLAINDVYFDTMDTPLRQLKNQNMRNISAGDGSLKALQRIHKGLSRQVATVAEPLGEQGWQLIDELNRAFAGQPPSGYVTKPVLITHELLQGRPEMREYHDTDNSYQAGYLQLWRPARAAP